jgi:hypothetical protein
MDKGPWSLFYGPPPKRELVGVISEDFERDVVLKVSGDFIDQGEKERYCNWLLGVLNTRAQ